MSYEMVCGLETHVELATKTKIFCSCTTEFGGEPNTHCCPVCTGMPGTLPKLNRAVVEYAVTAGLATHCEINPDAKMDRKNYVYPDLPKAYQISQYDQPLCRNGWVELSGGKKIRLTRIHIEEDAAIRSSTTTAAACRSSRSCRNPTSAAPPRRSSTWKSFRRSCVTSASPTAKCRRARCAAT